MALKKIILLLSVTIILVSILGVCASDYQYDVNELKAILDNTDESEMVGCCSVMLQLEGNDSMFAFRRDASFPAHIYIKNYTDWHGHKAVKQYKEDGGYFCQAIVTDDGWTIGYGGIDDGIDNERIENITAGMINKNNTILFNNYISLVVFCIFFTDILYSAFLTFWVSGFAHITSVQY